MFAYDDAGRIVSEADAYTSNTYLYDSLGRLVRDTQANILGPTVVLVYTYEGTNTNPSTLAASIDGVADFTNTYEYDDQGNLVRIVQTGQSGGNAVADKDILLTYNDDGQFLSADRYLDDVLAVEADLTYDFFGRLVGLVYHQGETVLSSYLWTYSSDQGSVVRGQEDSMFSWLPNGGLPVIGTVDSGEGMLPVDDTSGVVEALLSGDYSSSTASQLASCTTLDGTATYTYDATGQLTGVTYSSSSPQSPTPNPESYTYDANGNRTSVAGTGPVPTAYLIGPDNQLLSDGTYWYTYDADGNRTARFVWTDTDADGQIDTDEASQITQYRWDNRNRLVQVTERAALAGPATQIVTNYYDAENRWVGRAVDPDDDTGTAAIQLTTFAYAGNQIILQFDGTAATAPDPLGVGEVESSENQEKLTAQHLSHRYLWADAVDQLLADEQLEATASGYDLTTPGTVVLPLTDQLGTVRDLAVCENGVTSVANHRVYDSYGNLKSETNAAVDCVFGFTGRPWDKATGLQNNLNRWYDAKVGTWLSEDPVGFEGRQVNTSVYCGNDPVNGRDPSGLADINFGELAQQYGRILGEAIEDEARNRANSITSLLGITINDDNTITYQKIVEVTDPLTQEKDTTTVFVRADVFSKKILNATFSVEGEYDGKITYERLGDTDTFHAELMGPDGAVTVDVGAEGIVAKIGTAVLNDTKTFAFVGGALVLVRRDNTQEPEFAVNLDAVFSNPEHTVTIAPHFEADNKSSAVGVLGLLKFDCTEAFISFTQGLSGEAKGDGKLTVGLGRSF